MSETIRELISEEEVDKRIRELGEEISRDYAGKQIHLICVLKGGVFFMCELAKRITVPVSMDFMCVGSYGDGTKSSGVVRIAKDLDEAIEGKEVLIVEDIIDSGNTLYYLMDVLQKRKPASLRLCTLLDKPERRVKDVKVDYVGFEIPDEFVVGYGLDYAQKYRNLPYISYLEEVAVSIVHQAEQVLGERIPQMYTVNGKVFRKYLGIRLVRNKAVWGKLAEATRLDENKLRVGLDEEKAAAEFLCKIGVKFIEWPFTWTAGESRMNRAYLKASFLKIIKIEEVKLDAKDQYIEGSNILVKDLSVSPHRLASYIQTYYPQYWGTQEYDVKECVQIHKVTEEWGIFCNFAPTPIQIHGVMFKNCEQLYQVLKFQDATCISEVYHAPNPKFPAKRLETLNRRSDWGKIFIDVMKFCLQMKYEQSPMFRNKLSESKGKYIVELQTDKKTSANAWGVKSRKSMVGEDAVISEKLVGPNLLGRLLMELRENGCLEYTLPDNLLNGLAGLE